MSWGFGSFVGNSWAILRLVNTGWTITAIIDCVLMITALCSLFQALGQWGRSSRARFFDLPHWLRAWNRLGLMGLLALRELMIMNRQIHLTTWIMYELYAFNSAQKEENDFKQLRQQWSHLPIPRRVQLSVRHINRKDRHLVISFIQILHELR